MSDFLSTEPVFGFREKSLTVFEAVEEIANVVVVRFSANAAIKANIDTFIIFSNFIEISPYYSRPCERCTSLLTTYDSIVDTSDESGFVKDKCF